MIEKEIIKAVRFSPDEMRVVQEKMRQFGTSNFSAFMDAEKLHNFIICRFMVSLCQSLSITPLHSLNLCKPFALWMPELFCFIHIEAFAIC